MESSDSNIKIEESTAMAMGPWIKEFQKVIFPSKSYIKNAN